MPCPELANIERKHLTVDKIPPDSAAGKYLRDRGIDLDFAVAHGAVWTEDEDEIRERLGLEEQIGWTGDKGPSDSATRRRRESQRDSRARAKFAGKTALGFPLHGGGGYFSKLFPVEPGKKDKGFRAAFGSRQPIFIPEETWEAKSDSSQAIFIAEGPVKALALLQAGFLSIGLIGTWMSERDGWYRPLMRLLRSSFEWRNREVFMALDADQKGKSLVRQSVIRNCLLLLPLGAVPRQLKWDNTDGKSKGIDDYLANKDAPKELAKLIADARETDLVSEFSADADISLVRKELHRTIREEIWFSKLTKQFAKKLGVTVRSFGSFKPPRRKENAESQAQGIAFEILKPWPGKVELSKAFTEAVELHRRFVFMTEPQAVVTVLWEGTSYFAHLLEIQAYLAITAPTRQCGKTTLFTLVSLFVQRPLVASNLTSAFLFRSVEKYQPTLITDEAQAILQKNEDLAEIYNAGHVKRTAYVGRMEKIGETQVEKLFRTFGPKVLALKGKIKDDSFQERCIEIRLARMVAGDLEEDFWDVLQSEPEVFTPARERFLRAITDSLDAIKAHRPSLPEFADGRTKQNWRPLWILAELAGDDWTELLVHYR
jgi:hypothetical protein